jgi:hypothetical protein
VVVVTNWKLFVVASIQSYDLERHCIFEVHFLYGIFVFGDLMQGCGCNFFGLSTP